MGIPDRAETIAHAKQILEDAITSGDAFVVFRIDGTAVPGALAGAAVVSGPSNGTAASKREDMRRAASAILELSRMLAREL